MVPEFETTPEGEPFYGLPHHPCGRPTDFFIMEKGRDVWQVCDIHAYLFKDKAMRKAANG